MATPQIVDPPDISLRVTRLELDVKVILCNQGKIRCALTHVAMQADMDRLEKKVDLLLEHFDLSLE